jgi:hypothetical protein
MPPGSEWAVKSGSPQPKDQIISLYGTERRHQTASTGVSDMLMSIPSSGGML